MTKHKAERPHIGIFGRSNYGKSSLINALTGQQTAIVSEVSGTTTDPVRKTMEISGLGAVTIVDTAGLDDTSALGQQRIAKTYKAVQEVDLALLVIANNTFGECEQQLLNEFARFEVPCVVVYNKVDICPLRADCKASLAAYKLQAVEISATTRQGLPNLVEAIRAAMPESAYAHQSLLADIVKPNQHIWLITPIDEAAPEGRLILPQVQVLRDVLDNDCTASVLKETSLQHTLAIQSLPDLVITDSQVFAMVNDLLPKEVRLTSFSVVLARQSGNLDYYLQGTPTLSKLKDGDKVLMLESCTHIATCSDIGRVKLPKLISRFTGKQLEYGIIAGQGDLPENIADYALVIQCGGCMATRKTLQSRIRIAVESGVPVTNYGMAIAYMNGIFNRAVEPFVYKK